MVWFPVVLVGLVSIVGAASAATFQPTIAPGSRVVPATVSGPTCPLPGNPSCYTPAFLKQAYGFPVGPGAPSGAGQTIVIVVAYGSPTLQSDLAVFAARNGLPVPRASDHPSSAPRFRGRAAPVRPSHGRSETAADVEYASAMAPGARIVVAVAATDDSQNILQVEREVLPRFPGAIVSQSFTADETGPASDPIVRPDSHGCFGPTRF